MKQNYGEVNEKVNKSVIIASDFDNCPLLKGWQNLD